MNLGVLAMKLTKMYPVQFKQNCAAAAEQIRLGKWIFTTNKLSVESVLH